MRIFHTLAISFCLVGLVSGCATTSQSSSDLAQEMNLYRPAVVLSYGLPTDARTNNAPAMLEALDRSCGGLPQDERQVVVVAKVGSGGGDIALERAKGAAAVLVQSGENGPRMYVRQLRAGEGRPEGAVELFVFEKGKWSDQAFAEAMTTESVEVKAFGGVLRSDIARASLHEVFKRSVITTDGDLHTQMAYLLGMVGWQLRAEKIPEVDVGSKEYVLSLPSSGMASPREVIALIKSVATEAGVQGMDIQANGLNKVVFVKNGIVL